MKRKMFKLLVLALLTAIALPIRAQGYEFIWKINTRLEEGNCESAQKIYNAYREIYNRDISIEQRIAACRNPDDFSAQGYVDLGLPSGTLWKAVQDTGHFSYSEAVSKFGENIPNDEQWSELLEQCTWEAIGPKEWFYNNDNGESYIVDSGGIIMAEECGYKVTGKNGKSIFLIADGYVYLTDDYPLCVGCGGIVGVLGFYWSKSPKCFRFGAREKGLVEWWEKNTLNQYKFNVIQVKVPQKTPKVEVRCHYYLEDGSHPSIVIIDGVAIPVDY